MPGIATRGGGPAQNLFAAVPYLAALGWSTTVFATDAGAPAGAQTRELREEDLPAGWGDAKVRTFSMRPPRRFAYSPGLRRALARDVARFDILRVHSLFLYPQYAAGRAAHRREVPYIV